jgi:hypothetical protein
MEVGWACDDVPCDVVLIENSFVPSCEQGEKPTYGQSWGRFFSLWSTCGDAAWFPFEERLVACNTSNDCPNLYYYKEPAEFDCIHGLCQNIDTDKFPRNRLLPFHVELLCYGNVPRTATTSLFDVEVERVQALVTAQCPSAGACTVPAECLQP